MHALEKTVEDWILTNSKSLSLRVKRFLAMYFPNSKIRRQFWIETSVKLGEGTYLNPNVVVVDDYTTGDVLLELGNNCSVAPAVVFASYSAHNNSEKLRQLGILEKYESRKKITIGNDVWIGANCTIAAGVTIGDCCIIGANSFVNKDIPAYSLAFGAPVRVVKDLREEN